MVLHVTCKSVDETLACDHSNDSYYTILSCGVVGFSIFYLMKLGMFFNFELGHFWE